MTVATTRAMMSPTTLHKTTVVTSRSRSLSSNRDISIPHAERGLGPTGASPWTFLDMTDIKPESQLIVPGHPNELDPRLAILCPPHNSKINAHGPVLVHIDAQLNGLPPFQHDRCFQ